jgi:DNA helicase II / ATP-dependent DNA helicase PcrA
LAPGYDGVPVRTALTEWKPPADRKGDLRVNSESAFPGPGELGRGLVVQSLDAIPAACAEWVQVVIDASVLADPRPVADRMHALWLRRVPMVVGLEADAEALRTPELTTQPPWQLNPDFEFSRERLQFLVWSNNYDGRSDPPVWWHARRAQRLGAMDGGAADVVLPDGRAVWCDGGPRQPLDAAEAVLHRESIEAGSLEPDRFRAPSALLAADQLAAVSHRVGAARVIAPAGSGKTRVLTERLRHLLVDRAVTPSAVLAVAFNKRAADEMVERTAGLAARIRTLNSLGLAIVNGSGNYRSVGPARSVIDEREVRRIVEGLVDVRPRANTDVLAPYIEALSAIRLGLSDPREVESEIADAEGVAGIFDRYRAVLADRRLIDFDEQIYAAIEVLLRDPRAGTVPGASPPGRRVPRSHSGPPVVAPVDRRTGL